MKRLVLAVALPLALAWGPSALACKYNFTFVAGNDLTQLILNPQLKDPPITDQQCATFQHYSPFLHANQLKFNVNGDNFVSHGVAIGWASVQLMDSHGIVSSEYSQQTSVVANPDDIQAQKNEYKSVVNAVFGLNLRHALSQLRQREIAAGIQPIPAVR